MWAVSQGRSDLFWLRHMEGYNSSELGKLFDLPSSTVRARLASAKKLRKIYLEQKGKGRIIMEKRKLVINAAICDCRSVTEILNSYESIQINTSCILVSKIPSYSHAIMLL